MRSSFLTFLAILLTSCQSPQNPRYVITEGHATVRVPIQVIKVGIAVDSKAKTLSEANQDNRAIVLRVFAALKQMGINDSDFVTDRSAAEIDRNYREGFEQPTVSYSGTVTLRQPDRYDELLKSLTDVGKVAVGIAGYSNGELEQYRVQAYNEAFNAAKRDAEMLLAPSGGKVGRVLKVLKSGYDPFERYDNADKEMDQHKSEASYVAAAEAKQDFERIFRRRFFEVSQDATVMFEIQ